MKLYIIALVSIALVGAVVADEVCYQYADDVCSNRNTKEACNSRYGGISHVEVDLQDYVNRQLLASYDYIRLSTFFNSYQKDRPGFVKLFRSMSDRAFEDSIKLIKHITRRGGEHDIKTHRVDPNDSTGSAPSLESNEVQAIGAALDKEKQLARKAIQIHSRVSKIHAIPVHDSQDLDQENTVSRRANRNPSHVTPVDYDPEISQFFEEEFLRKQSETIRKLSGYANDVLNIFKGPTASSLGIYLFDEYLQKQ